MKSPNLTLAVLAGLVAIALTAWKLSPALPIDQSTEPARITSLSSANKQQTGSTLFSYGSNSESPRKPEITKTTDRFQVGKVPRKGTKRPSAEPKVSSRPNPVVERLRPNAARGRLAAPLPAPAVLIALDPSVSEIPADHEPAVQAMAEDAAKILQDYGIAVEEIKENTTLSPSNKAAALLALRERVNKGIHSIDYAFRAKFGARVWMSHHIAAHQALRQKE